MDQRPLLLLVLLLASGLAPGALAHGGEDDGHEPAPPPVQDTPELLPPTEGYTGPGREPYLHFFQGAWLYGRASATPLGDQIPRHLRGDGDWLVWEDARRGDIYAYNIPAGSGLYLTSDGPVQRHPEISGNLVVWEDYRHGLRPHVYVHFLDTGETRRVSNGTGAHRTPSVHGSVVAWEDDRHGTRDIYGYDLVNQTEFAVHVAPDRESDPLVFRDTVYFRTYRFNVWDILAYDLRRGELYEVTSDPEINGAPWTNGEDVYFLSQYFSAWTVMRYDVVTERVQETRIKLGDTSRFPADGDYAIQAVRDVRSVQLVARNLTSGTSLHVSGDLAAASEPEIIGRTVFLMVAGKNGTSLLALEVSPFAFGRQPTLSIASPSANAPWVRPVNLLGVLVMPTGFTEPATFTVRVDGEAPIAVLPGPRWSVTLDPEGFDPGLHRVVVRATFREGPPLTAVTTLYIPTAADPLDVEDAGNAYHAARVFGALNQYVVTNPGSYVLIPLLLVLLLLVGLRLWVVVRPRRRRRVEVEYVPPE